MLDGAGRRVTACSSGRSPSRSGPPGTEATDPQLADAVWDLAWSGRLTNDTLAPLRALLGSGRTAGATAHRAPRAVPRGRYGALAGRAPRHRLAQRAADHRGPLVAAARRASRTRPYRAHALTHTLLDRHGVVTRGAVAAEGVEGGFSAAYRVLSAFEETGQARRGYVVEGLGAAQFAMDGAVDRLRALSTARERDGGPRHGSARTVVLAAADPANAYGAALPWPEPPGRASTHRPGRKAGALVVLVDGELALYVERGGKTLLAWPTDEDTRLAGGRRRARRWPSGRAPWARLTVERANGEAALTSPLGRALEAAGFHATPRGLRLRGPGRPATAHGDPPARAVAPSGPLPPDRRTDRPVRGGASPPRRLPAAGATPDRPLRRAPASLPARWPRTGHDGGCPKETRLADRHRLHAALAEACGPTCGCRGWRRSTCRAAMLRSRAVSTSDPAGGWADPPLPSADGRRLAGVRPRRALARRPAPPGPGGAGDRRAHGRRLPAARCWSCCRTGDEDRAVGPPRARPARPGLGPGRGAYGGCSPTPARPLGEALLDQRNLAGIGNVYKSRAVLPARCHPVDSRSARSRSAPSAWWRWPSGCWRPTRTRHGRVTTGDPGAAGRTGSTAGSTSPACAAARRSAPRTRGRAGRGADHVLVPALPARTRPADPPIIDDPSDLLVPSCP